MAHEYEVNNYTTLWPVKNMNQSICVYVFAQALPIIFVIFGIIYDVPLVMYVTSARSEIYIKKNFKDKIKS